MLDKELFRLDGVSQSDSLPADVVLCPSIATFKSRLTDIALTQQSAYKHPVFIAQLALVFISLDSVISCSRHSCTATMYDNTQLLGFVQYRKIDR